MGTKGERGVREGRRLRVESPHEPLTFYFGIVSVASTVLDSVGI